MYLAINYSPQAAHLLQSGQIEIDYFKTPDWDWMVSEAQDLRPVAVHFTLEAGNNGLGEVDWTKVQHLVQITNTPYINIHLDARQKHYSWLSVDATSKSEMEQVYKVLLSDVKILVKHFGPENVIVENSPYRGEQGNTLRMCVEPDMITQIVEETGCGLLLDISHAIVSATYMSMDPVEYFSRLPVHKMKEMHFAGIHQINHQWIDHLSIQEKDWSWLDWVLAQIRSGEWSNPWLLAFEYGGVGATFEWCSDPTVIARQVPELLARVKSTSN